MQPSTNVPINNSSDDDDDDDDLDGNEGDDHGLHQEASEKIEKFVQTRHVQTLKYLQHVIDENRHLRLHIEHLKRRQNDPVPSPGVVDPIDPEDPPITEIPIEVPEVPEIFVPVKTFNTIGTNTDGEDFEAKCRLLKDEILNLKKEHHVNREEFRRELERLDEKNLQYEKDLHSTQEQLIRLQSEHHQKLIELQTVSSYFNEERSINQRLNQRISELENGNKRLVRSLEHAERIQNDLYEQNRENLLRLENTEQRLTDVQTHNENHLKQIKYLENEISSLNVEANRQEAKFQALKDEHVEARQNIELLEQQLQEKIVQEEKLIREKQANNHFKEFVQIKRTLQLCQQENEQLKVELKKVQMKLLMN